MSPRTLLILVLLAGVLGLSAYVAHQSNALRAAALQRDSLEVAIDSSRRAWRYGVQVAERRAFQSEVQLAQALQQGRAVGASLVRVTLERDSLLRITSGEVHYDSLTPTRFVTTGKLEAESIGVTVRAAVVIQGVQVVPGRLPTSTFDWSVQRAPLQLDVALVCLPGHRAEARISTPSSVPVTITGATSRADVCYPPPQGWSMLKLDPPGLPWLVAAFGLGLLVK